MGPPLIQPDLETPNVPKLKVSGDDADDNMILIIIIIIIVGIIVGLIVYVKLTEPDTFHNITSTHCEGLKSTYKLLGLDPGSVCAPKKCGKDRDPVNGKCTDPYKLQTIDNMSCCIIDPQISQKDKDRLAHASHVHMAIEALEIGGVVVGDILLKKVLKKVGKAGVERLFKSRYKRYLSSQGLKGAEKSATDAAESAAESTAERAAEQSAERAAEKSAERAAEEALEKGVAKAGEEIGETVSEDALVMGGCLAVPPPIGEIAAAGAFVVMVIQVLGTLGDLIDVGGFNQYMDNEKDILTMRDQLEGGIIDIYSTYPNFPKPPFTFNLSNLAYLRDYKNSTDKREGEALLSAAGTDKTKLQVANSKIYDMQVIQHPELKNIYDVFRMAQSAQMAKATRDLMNNLSEDDAVEYFTAMLDPTKDMPQKFKDALKDIKRKDPLAADTFLWDSMRHAAVPGGTMGKDKPPIDLGIRGSSGKYLIFRPEISSKTKCGISLNQAGVDLYNSVVKKLPEIKDNPRQYLVYTKYYRDIYKPPEPSGKGNPPGKKYFLKQNAMPVEFALISYSYAAVNDLCTIGLDKESLKAHYPIQGWIHANWMVPSVKKPKDHGVSYDPDTGLCKYDTRGNFWKEHGWCMYMDRETMPEMKTMVCDNKNGGCAGAKYPVCHKNRGEEIIEWVFPQTVIGEVRRILGDAEDFIENDVGHAITHAVNWIKSLF